MLKVICQLMSVMALRDTDSMSFLLHLCASCLMYMPSEQAHNKIVGKLCEYILPMTICKCVTAQAYAPVVMCTVHVYMCTERDDTYILYVSSLSVCVCMCVGVCVCVCVCACVGVLCVCAGV